VSESKLREAVCSQVAKLLRELRVERGLSMTELAARAGLSRAMISFIEHELRNPTLDTLLRIASVLKVDLADVLKRAEAEASKTQRR
jgi:transcriptional regulator with XRE-family HTH domain